MSDLPDEDSHFPEPFSNSMTDHPRSERSLLITRVVSRVLERRLNGELVHDEDVINAHQQLMPELAQELAVLHRINGAVQDAKKAGPILQSIPKPESGNGNGHSELNLAEKDEAIRITIEGYYIECPLSHGGQATVFQGGQSSTGRKVAIKVIHGGSLTSSQRRARFEREAEILAALNHPNIVGIIDRGRASDGSFFFVMELIDGSTLDEYLKSKHESDPRIVVRLFATIADAVDEAHRNQVIHRDLKPSNIRIDTRGDPHILDFGLARLLEEDQFDAAGPLTITGQVVGSLPWASPEQAQGAHREVDARSDVYSIGVMLYQALAGQLPYKLSGTFREVQDAICRSRPTPFSAIQARPFGQIDSSLQAIVMRALEKNPAKRYAAAAELAQDLRNYVQGAAVTAALLRARKLHRPLIIVAVILLPLLVGIFLWLHKSVAGPPTYTNSIGMEFVLVPAGHFMMGSPEWEAGRQDNELEHEVTISRPYFLASKEVTVTQFVKVTGTNPGNPQFRDPDAPVQGVNYLDAMKFCELLGKQDGNEYTLPTEAQWEYAARAGTKGHVFGDSDDLEPVAWYRKNSNDAPHRVGTKRPNPWGLYDMIGNSREWCRDGPRDYTSQMVQDPIGPMTGPWRVVRGGSWSNTPQFCRAASRHYIAVLHRIEDGGFRVVQIKKH